MRDRLVLAARRREKAAPGVSRVGAGGRLKRHRSLLLFANAAILLITGCSRRFESSPSIRIEQQITPQPVRIGPATVTLRLVDFAGNPVSGARITLEGDMTHPGMSPVFSEAEEISPGHYQAHLEFSMAGDWVLLLHVKLPGGQELGRQIDVRGVQPN